MEKIKIVVLVQNGFVRQVYAPNAEYAVIDYNSLWRGEAGTHQDLKQQLPDEFKALFEAQETP